MENTEGKIKLDKKVNNKRRGEEVAGTIYGNTSTSSVTYGMDKFNTPRGHGFAAERANHLVDKVSGKEAYIVGDDNALNGADRLVNGIEIQSKYCSTGSKCIQECFENGKFRYISKDGKPMNIEVPADKFDDAVKAMKSRIEKGEVSGVNDPKEAENIIKKGFFTYEQAKNISKFGTVESLTYDAVNGMIIASNAFGISAVLSFAIAIWNGEDFETSIKNAAFSGLKVGGISFLTTVISSQLTRTSLNKAIQGGTDYLVKALGPKASAQIANALRNGKNIYGAAAMKNVSKLLNGNFIANAVTVVIISSVDVVNIFRGRISGKQLFKNITTAVGSMAGGTAGWVGGAAAGAAIGSVVPVVGTAAGSVVGAIAGALAGGSAGGALTNAALGIFIEEDANEMVRIIEEVISQLSADYLLNQNELEEVVELLKEDLGTKALKDMFASLDRYSFAKNLIESHIKSVIANRRIINMPNDEEMIYAIRNVLEDEMDGIGIFAKDYDMHLLMEQAKSLDGININEQLDIVMQPVFKMNETQIKIEKEIIKMVKAEKVYLEERQSILEQRSNFKSEINSLLQ